MAQGMIQPALLKTLNTKLNSRFAEVLEPQGQVTDLMAIVDSVPASTLYTTFAWIALRPQWREWVGPRAVQGMKARAYQQTIKNYESTVGVDRDDLDDIAYIATLQKVANSMSEEAINMVRQSIIDALINGTTTVGYDGQYFFDTDHPQSLDGGSGSQSNYVSSGRPLKAAGADPWANITYALGLGWAFKGESGRPFGAFKAGQSNLLLIVPSALYATARLLVSVDELPDGSGGFTPNPWKDFATVVMVPELDVAGLTTTWMLFDITGSAKPINLLRRKDPVIVTKSSPTDSESFWFKEVLVGGEMRYGVAPAFWWKAIRLTA